VTRVYVPTTIAGLSALSRDGVLPPGLERLVAAAADEESEYAALMAAAEESAALLESAGLRVVVVAEVADPDGVVRRRDVVAVHADPSERSPGADPDEDLAWYATQEIEAFLAAATPH
jgi:hypothetical protein